MLTTRHATLEDINAITAIYNEAVTKTTATFDTEPKTQKELALWFTDHESKNPILVAIHDDVIIGWGSLSKWSERSAYSDTAEISLYVREEHQGKGYGKNLLEAIITEGEKCNLHTVIARITEGNKSSIHLHELFGFTHIGIMKEVGFKFGKRLDVYLMQKIYEKNR